MTVQNEMSASRISSTPNSMTYAKTSISYNSRHSGIELLRLLSMVFILALHINFFAFGQPTSSSFESDFLGCSLRFFWESLSIVGVNTFVLISGWFGIRSKMRSVLSPLFQCAFFCCVLYAAVWMFGVEFSRRKALKNRLFPSCGLPCKGNERERAMEIITKDQFSFANQRSMVEVCTQSV